MMQIFKHHLFLFFLALIPNLCIAYEHSDLPKPDRIAHEIIYETTDFITKKYDINPCGIGMNGKFEYLEISFQVHRPLSRQIARKLLYECVTIFLEKVNTNESIRPYLKNYPFTFKNAGIIFFITDENNNDLSHPELTDASWNSHGVFFRTIGKKNKYRYKETYEETHEEALALLGKDAPSEALSTTNSQ